MVVTPNRAASRSAARAERRFISRDESGMTLSTSASALSLRIPVGSPEASRTIVPPSGSFVSRVTPARRRAAELAEAIWPSSRLTKTGWSRVTASMSCRVGSLLLGQDSWSQFPWRIHVPFGSVFA